MIDQISYVFLLYIYGQYSILAFNHYQFYNINN